jgi:hypothetical protein
MWIGVLVLRDMHLILIHLFPSFPKKKQNKNKTRGVSPLWPLPFTFKSILMQKKNYENSNISLCKNIIFKKSSKRNQNPSRY